MTLGLLFFVLFLLGYAVMFASLIFQLNEYSFSRQSRFAVTMFMLAGIIFAISAIILFPSVDWGNIIEYYFNA